MNDKLTGLYLGTVLKHLSHGCLKVFIPSVFPDSLSTSPERLPTCMQIVPLFAGNANGNGVFSYPNISSTVVCMFANGDLNLPFTFGSIQGGVDARAQYELIDGAKEHKQPISSSLANVFANNDADLSSISKMHRFTAGSTSLTFDEDGSLSALIESPMTTHTSSDAVAESFSKLYMLNKDGAPAISVQTITEDVDSILTMDATGDISIKTKSNDVSCVVDMNTKGTITIDVNGKDVNGKSTITLDKDGNAKIETTNTITARSHDIILDGGAKVAIKAPVIDIAANATINITGPSGDCVIDSTSLNNHTHPFPYMAGPSPSTGTTLPPSP